MEQADSLPPSYDHVVNSSGPSVPTTSYPSQSVSPIAFAVTPRSTEAPLHILFNPTLKPYPNFNVNSDVKYLADALRNEPDENTIIRILCHRTSDQRIAIFNAYHAYTGHYLIEDIKKQFNFNLYVLLAGLSVPYFEYMARMIHRGVSFKWLHNTLFTISNQEVMNMKHYFESKYNSTVERFVERAIRRAGNKHPDRFLRKPLLRLLEVRRDENLIISPNAVEYDIRRLASINPSTFSCKREEKEILKDIFYYKNWSHIRTVCENYNKQYNHSVFDVIQRCYPWQSNDVFSNIATYALNKDFYFAKQLNVSMKGLGTDDPLLIHIILRRSEIDLADIKVEFLNLYKQTLREWVHDDTSGNYRNGLFALMGEQ